MAKALQFFTLNETPKPTVSRLPRCGKCGLSSKCTQDMPKGNGNKGILIVTDSFKDSREEQACIEYIQKVLDRVCIDLHRDCITIPCIKCKTDNAVANNVDCCFPHMATFIKNYNPSIIIPFGQNAITSIVKTEWNDSIGDANRWCGWNIPSRMFNAWVCPAYGITYKHEQVKDRGEVKTQRVIRIGGIKEDMVIYKLLCKQVEKAISHNGKPYDVIPDELSTIRLVDRAQAVIELKKINEMTCTTAFDYETTGLKPQSDKQKIVSASISTGIDTIAFMMEGDDVKEEFKKYLLNPNIGKIASNMKFEECWSRAKFGVEVVNWDWDTMLAAHILDQKRGITSIKFLSYVHLGIGDYSSHIHESLKATKADEAKYGGNAINRIYDLKERDLLLYNGMDSLLEYKVAMIQKGIL